MGRALSNGVLKNGYEFDGIDQEGLSSVKEGRVEDPIAVLKSKTWQSRLSEKAPLELDYVVLTLIH